MFNFSSQHQFFSRAFHLSYGALGSLFTLLDNVFIKDLRFGLKDLTQPVTVSEQQEN